MQAPGLGIWLDCIRFDPPFFAHLDKIDPGQGWAEAAVSDILGYRELLPDAEIGNYNHFWLEKVQRPYTRGWIRGQGCALLGPIDVAEYLPNGPAGAIGVMAEALRLARRMLDFQLPDGNWHCMVHEPLSGPESFTAALMATAFFRGVHLGLLPVAEFAGPAEQAYRAMEANLDCRRQPYGRVNRNHVGAGAAASWACAAEPDCARGQRPGADRSGSASGLAAASKSGKSGNPFSRPICACWMPKVIRTSEC